MRAEIKNPNWTVESFYASKGEFISYVFVFNYYWGVVSNHYSCYSESKERDLIVGQWKIKPKQK